MPQQKNVTSMKIIELINSAENGDAEAQYELGRRYRDGDYIQSSTEKAIHWFTLSAHQDNASAQNDLGCLCENEAEKSKWFRKAVEHGDQTAQRNYLNRCRHDHYYSESDLLWLKSKAKENSWAAKLLGDFYYSDKLSRPQEAMKWYLIAAEDGDIEAQYKLGCIYRDGFGTPKNIEMAFLWFQKAAIKQHEDAQCELGCLYLSDDYKNYDLAYKWLSSAAIGDSSSYAFGGSSKAQYHLAQMYEFGLGIPKNSKSAAHWYEYAAQEFYEPLFDDLFSENRIHIIYDLFQKIEKHQPEKSLIHILIICLIDPQNISDWIDEEVIAWLEGAEEYHISYAKHILNILYFSCLYDFDREMYGWFPLEFSRYIINPTIKYLTTLALNGSVEQKYRTGQFYGLLSTPRVLQLSNGDTQQQDKYSELRLYWMCEAAKLGHVEAKKIISRIYLEKEYYENALFWLHDLAEDNNIYALQELGLLYEIGMGVQQDDYEALNFYRKALQLGEKPAQRIEVMFQFNDYNQKWFGKSFDWYKLEANKGNIFAQSTLGFFYAQEFNNIEKNHQKSIYWYKKAANADDSWAQLQLGFIYLKGIGVDQDNKQAFDWFKKAANQNNRWAQYQIGLMYKDGLTEINDPKKSIDYFESAAIIILNNYPNHQLAHYASLMQLAQIYEEGIMIEPDLSKVVKYLDIAVAREPDRSIFEVWMGPALLKLKEIALAGNQEVQFEFAMGYGCGNSWFCDEDNTEKVEFWCKKAMEQGDTEAAKYAAGEIAGYSEAPELDQKKATYYYQWAAERGNEEAQYETGKRYAHGVGTDINFNTALKWLLKLSENGDFEAQYELGLLYFNHQDMDKNRTEAIYWLTRSAENGCNNAKEKLSECYEAGIGVHTDSKMAMQWKISVKEIVYSEQKKDNSTDNLNIGKRIKRSLLEKQENRYHSKQHRSKTYDYRGKAEQGDMDAQLALGKLYADGLKVPQNLKEAAKWLYAAAEQGNVEAQTHMGYLYLEGEGGLPNDHKQAISYFSNAAKRGNIEATYALGNMYEGNEAITWYQQAAEKNYGLAQINLGLMLMEVEEDQITLISQAKHWFKQAQSKEAVWPSNLPDEQITAYQLLAKHNYHAADNIQKYIHIIHNKNKSLQEKNNELQELMAMFSHKFRGPLDSIIYNIDHQQNKKVYKDAVETMRGLLDIFSYISIDPEQLQPKLINDYRGDGCISAVLKKSLGLAISQLLHPFRQERISQHYYSYAKKNELLPPDVDRIAWEEELEYELLQNTLQKEWENQFMQLFLNNAGIIEMQQWLNDHAFPFIIEGFEHDNIRFKRYGSTESILTIVFTEILLNAIKYYYSDNDQPLIVRWIKQDNNFSFICENPSIRQERRRHKGSNKGHHFLRLIAKNLEAIFPEPDIQDNYIVCFSIPSQLLEDSI